VRHTERDAAAKCRSCGGYFCRECITEYDAELYCAACLQRTTQLKTKSVAKTRGRWFSPLITCLAILFVWAIFFLLGTWVAQLPPPTQRHSPWQAR